MEDSFFLYIKNYLFIRTRQILIVINLIIRLSGSLILDLKGLLIRKMYWGRTSFYKTSFHILVIFTTLLALYSGLGNRIIASQRYSIENITVSDRTILDSDIVSQQGATFPIADQNNSDDNLYNTYVVQTGDSLDKIAQVNSINSNTIRWANGIPDGRDTLKVGQSIRIPIIDGVLYTVIPGDNIDKIVSKVQNAADKFTIEGLNAQSIDSTGNFIVGSIIFIPNASLIQQTSITKQAPVYNSGIVRTAVVVTTAAPSISVPNGTFVNPLQGCSYSFSRGFSSTHSGVDLGVAPGCWVVAAASGIIMRAGWCGSIGYCVVIAHSNGIQTIYGHGNGVMSVVTGQTVVAGQRTMQSGCTGQCFGPHVHISITESNQDVWGCIKCRINPAGIIPY